MRLFPLPLHLTLGWAGVLATLGLVGFYVPTADKTIGESYLIFFFHFPSAVNCLNLFVIAGVVSGLYLARSSPRLDLWAASAIEVGLLACTITLVTGSIWARAAWGIFWDVRDPRLMTVAIMWLTYAGYLALRGTMDEPVKKALFSGVFGVIAAINVPIVYFAIQFFGQSHHPMNVDLTQFEMRLTEAVGATAFLVLYTAFWRMRFRVHWSRHELNRMESAFHRSGI